MGLQSQHLFEFGPFVLDKARHLLTKQGNPVAITPKTYDLLLRATVRMPTQAWKPSPAKDWPVQTVAGMP